MFEKINKEETIHNKHDIIADMQLTLDREAFLKKLEIVSKVSTKHLTLPVLQCVLLKAEDSTLQMSSTNLELGIEANMKASVTKGGDIAVPASVLLQTVSLVSEKEITLKEEDGGLVVRSGNGESLIKSVPFEDFPSIPKVEGGGQKLNNKLFSLGIKSVAFAASQTSIKPELGSVYVFQKKEHSLTFVATDSFRLMEKTVPQKGVFFDSSVLIPQKNAIEISRILDALDSDPLCRFNENQFSLDFEEGVYVTSRLVAGSFPDYEQIMPKEFSTSAVLLREDLTRSFRKTSIFLNKFSQVGLSVGDNSLKVSAVGGDAGTTTESVRAEIDGEGVVLNFNQRYLSEGLAHFVDDSVMLQLSGVGRPLVVKGVSDGTVRYLVMPMNK
ncbi:MAG: DNA polymerase III subunit beta [Candidatus Paceibacterota bacterium]